MLSRLTSNWLDGRPGGPDAGAARVPVTKARRPTRARGRARRWQRSRPVPGWRGDALTSTFPDMGFAGACRPPASRLVPAISRLLRTPSARPSSMLRPVLLGAPRGVQLVRPATAVRSFPAASRTGGRASDMSERRRRTGGSGHTGRAGSIRATGIGGSRNPGLAPPASCVPGLPPTRHFREPVGG